MFYYVIFNKNYGGYTQVKTKKKIKSLKKAEKLINWWEYEPNYVKPNYPTVHYLPVMCMRIPAWKYYAAEYLPCYTSVYKRLDVVIEKMAY